MKRINNIPLNEKTIIYHLYDGVHYFKINDINRIFSPKLNYDKKINFFSNFYIDVDNLFNRGKTKDTILNIFEKDKNDFIDAMEILLTTNESCIKIIHHD